MDLLHLVYISKFYFGGHFGENGEYICLARYFESEHTPTTFKISKRLYDLVSYVNEIYTTSKKGQEVPLISGLLVALLPALLNSYRSTFFPP